MIVLSMNNAPPKLRGFLTKYLWEISTGVYVGDVNVRIREAIWKRVRDNIDSDGRAVIVYPADNEQGFDFNIIGSAWKPLDHEGLKLILRPSEKILFGNWDTKSKFLQPDKKRYENEYVVLDLETTGLDVREDKILEIGAIIVADGVCREEFNRLIAVHVPEEITELTGITQKMADGGVSVADAVNELSEFLDGRTVVGYNIRMFDMRMLKQECMRNGVKLPLKKVVDAMDIARHALSGLSSYSMRSVAEHMGIKIEYAGHRALLDCRLCNEIYMQLVSSK